MADQQQTTEGAHEVERDGKPVAGAYPHPRSITDWLAVVPPRDWRDSGMKRFKTRRGAVAWVERRMAEMEAPADA